MERCIRIEKYGGPEVMVMTDVDLPPPAPDEVRMRNNAIGLNFIDTYHRRGVYPIDLPGSLGVEGAGVIEAVGDDVAGFSVGDRVCTFGQFRGSYSTARNIPARLLYHTPDGISDELAAAAMLKGCTVEFLVERCAKVQPGQTVLVHAAAGGVGLLLVQWLKHIGAKVIGTVGTTEKAAIALAAGADTVIQYGQENTASRVREVTHDEGVQVTFDGVGMDTWQASLDSTGRRGLIVSYGNASAPVTNVSLGILATKGSLFCTRPTIFDYYVEQEERNAGVRRMFDMLSKGAIEVTIGQTYSLGDVARAHRHLEGRKTVGSTVILP